MELIRFVRERYEIFIDLFVLLAIEIFLLSYFRPELLFLPTTITGGDTPSLVPPADYLRKVLLPSGNPLGWDPRNFAGYPPFQYYNLLPFTLIAFLSLLIPLEVAFKLVTVLGILGTPLAVYATFRYMRYPHPLPAIAASSILAFLFNEGNSMWGGNILSTLAGEFCFSIALALAILFWGRLWRGIETGSGVTWNAILLAAIGLSHPIPFLYATLAGCFFLFQKRNILHNLAYLIRVYGAGTLLMGFWLLPLMAKIGYATSINWTWASLSFSELFPKILVPFLILAGVNLILFLAFPRLRDRRTAFLLFAVFANLIAFLNATAIGLPEIRFVPIIQIAIALLAVDLLRIGAGWLQMTSLLSPTFLVAIVVWVSWGTSNISAWIEWNYTGFERKAPWETFHQLNEFLKGTANDPRVFYEHATVHNQFGSIRAFESLPYFSSRSTLEGTLLQAALNSPFIYYLQAETSKEPSHVIPGYSYSRFNWKRGTKHLEMYNVSEVIAVSDEVKKTLDADPSYHRVFERKPYAIYRLETNQNHYVVVPPFKPVLFRATDWKQDFHRWFENESLLDIPLVLAKDVEPETPQQFEGPVDDLPAIPRVPLSNQCQIQEKISHDSIEFDTSCPGTPHLIRMSYFPNWKVEGARRIYLASPAFMLVIPEGRHVRLHYGYIAVDYAGGAMTLIGIFIVIGSMAPLRALQRIQTEGKRAIVIFLPHPSRIRERFERGVLGFSIVILTSGFAVGGWHYYGQGTPQRLYDRGWKLFDTGHYEEARKLFEEIRSRQGYDPMKVTATFFMGQTYFRENNYAKAITYFEALVRLYPEDSWVPETRYHIGRCLENLGRIEEAREMYQLVIEQDAGGRWAGFSREYLQKLPPPPDKKKL